MSTNRFPMIEEDPPSKFTRFCNSWIMLKAVYPLLNLPVRFYFWSRLNWILPVVALIVMLWVVSFVTLTDWWTKQIFISKVNIVKVAKAAEIEPVFPDIGDCEQYRPIVQKYFGKLTNEALFVASKESGCIADRISPKNSNGSRDYCLFQINSEPLTAQSLDTCVRRAWEKYVDGRIGHRNYSAWYAVCDTNGHPKYPKIISDCS